MDSLKSWVISDRATKLSLLVINFAVGILMGPTSAGIPYYVTFTLIYLCAVLYFDKGQTDISSPGFILGLLCTGLFGFIIGRLVSGRLLVDPFSNGSIL
jgi:hypothetical protein